MVKYTQNKQQEKQSRIEFERLVCPWDCVPPEHDTGIDLIVQPYDESQKNKIDGSLQLFKRRFLVQLKSTKNEKFDKKKGKLTIDIEHLLDWKKQADPVLIARYYIGKKKFYYTWIDQIDIKVGNKYQTIYLDNCAEQSSSDEFKKNLLMHIDPLNISEMSIMLDPKSLDKFYATGTIDNIRDEKQLTKFFNNDFMDKVKLRLFLEKEIFDIHSFLVEQPKNQDLRLKLAALYIQVKKYPEAIRELGVLIKKFNSYKAKILFSIIENGRTDIFDNIDALSFVFYLKWEQETPPGTCVKTYAIINGIKYLLSEYDAKGVILPIQEIKTLGIKHDLSTNDTSKTPTVSRKAFLMISMLDRNGSLLSEFGQIVTEFPGSR